jgi:ankyrin repeat protein
VEKLLLKVYPEGAAQKNNHGNLPLHYAAHYNAPLEVVEALYNAYPEGASQKNNDNNTPLDLAIADGASPNVVALLQGKTVPPTDDELLEGAKNRCERMEKELQRHMEKHDTSTEDLDMVLSLLMDIRDAHTHALYSAGINPELAGDRDALLDQVRYSCSCCYQISLFDIILTILSYVYCFRYVKLLQTVLSDAVVWTLETNLL